VSERQRLNDILAAIPNMSTPSTAKFNGFKDYIAKLLRLDSSRVTVRYVNKPGNLKVRLNETKLKGIEYAFAVVVLESQEHLENCIRLLDDYIGPGRTIEAMAFCVKSNEAWRVHTVLEAEGGPLRATLEAAFPGAAFIPLKGSVRATTAPPSADAAERSEVSHDELSESLFVPQDWLDEVLWLLEDKRGIVFYGPPGTGKTHMAMSIAAHVQPKLARRRLIQFHPNYGYEEFFEGYRPADGAGGTLRLTKTPGPLRKMAEMAEDGDPVVLVIDELNRGNLPKIFGELFFLLEYREESASLLYSPDESFSLPESLFVIGTMNTADRSIALVDQALRRRFHFVGLFPGEVPVAGMLRGFLTRYRPDMTWLCDLLEEANMRLGDPNTAIGPSHFMRDDIDELTARRIWKYSVLPTIADQYYGDEDGLKQFDFDALRKRIQERHSDDSSSGT